MQKQGTVLLGIVATWVMVCGPNVALGRPVMTTSLGFKTVGTPSLAGLGYNLQIYRITEGQTFESASVSGLGIAVRASRKQSDTMAFDFNADLASGNELSTVNRDPMPDSLDFVIYGNTTFTFDTGGGVLDQLVCDIRYALDYRFLDYFWWLGSSACHASGSSMVCTCYSTIRSSEALLKFSRSSSKELIVIPGF